MQLLIGGMVYGLALLWVYKTNRALRVGDLTGREKAILKEGAGAPVESFQQDI